MVKWKEFFQFIETAIDGCEDATERHRADRAQEWLTGKSILTIPRSAFIAAVSYLLVGPLAKALDG